MALRVSKGNMYTFVTHTWNPVKGKCAHDCYYCYMKRFELKELRLDERELKVNLGEHNTIFVGSSTDLFSSSVPSEWIFKLLEYVCKFNNRYLFQSKDTINMAKYIYRFPDDSIFCTTIETNRVYEHMGNSPSVDMRCKGLQIFSYSGKKTMVTVEPVLNFDIDELVAIIESVRPIQVNIGADSMGCVIPEPSRDKLLTLIRELDRRDIRVHRKPNLKRLMG